MPPPSLFPPPLRLLLRRPLWATTNTSKSTRTTTALSLPSSRSLTQGIITSTKTRKPTLLKASPLLLLPFLPLAIRPPTLLCDSPSPSLPSISSSAETREPTVPIFLPADSTEGSNSSWRLNPAAYRQLSAGSVLGLLGGVGISMFSRTLGILVGLGFLGLQYLASKGINVIPTERLQRYVKGMDLRSMLQDNAAFKLSFGLTFALASLAEF